MAADRNRAKELPARSTHPPFVSYAFNFPIAILYFGFRPRTMGGSKLTHKAVKKSFVLTFLGLVYGCLWFLKNFTISAGAHGGYT